MTTDQNDLARRVDEVFARATHPTAHPNTLRPSPANPEPAPVGFQRRAGDRLHSARWLVQACCCGHQRAAHLHYRDGTDCSGCDCARFDRAVTWAFVVALLGCCAFWAAFFWMVLR